MKIKLFIIAIIALSSCDNPMESDTPREIEIIDGTNERKEINSITFTVGSTEYVTSFESAYLENKIVTLNKIISENADPTHILEQLSINKFEYDLENESLLSGNTYPDGSALRRDHLQQINFDNNNNLTFYLEKYNDNTIEFSIDIKLNFPRPYIETGKLIIEY